MKKYIKPIVVITVISVVVLIQEQFEGKISEHHQGFYEKYIKRIQDFWCAVAALIILSPVMAVIAFLVRIKLGSPIIFKQRRPGKGEKLFEMYKFRTMTNERNSSGEMLSDEVRLTSFGRVLRSMSLDELPELINIIRGDMSFVGPRPLLAEYLSLYNEKQKHRHDVKPGLTGLAQISGRNRISWEEKFEDDIKYVENIRFITDWKIMLKTVDRVWKKDGISSKTSVTMEAFQGNKNN